MTTGTTGSARAGLAYILLATAIAGALGYAIQLTAGVVLTDASDYVAFAAFWSLLYVVVSAMSGIQQEVTRAARPSATPSARSGLMPFASVLVAITITVVLVVSVVRGLLGGIAPAEAGVALAVGARGYLAIALLSGVLYGMHQWRAVAALTVADAGIRAVLVLGALLLGAPSWVLFGLIAVPFVLAWGLGWLFLRNQVRGRFVLDEPPRRMLGFTAHTVGAAAGMGLMITGLPVLIQATSGQPAAQTAALIFAITVTRAPIVVPLQALQSFLVARLRDGDDLATRRVLALIGGGLVAAGVLGLAGAWLGPLIIAWLTSGRYDLTSLSLGTIVASAALVGLLTVTGSALLAARRHGAYVLGWLLAAAATVLLLITPLPFDTRFALALLLAPALGLVVHATALLRAHSSAA